jgi:F-type H+/Na+-transporting ATPase subunit alpha
MSQNKHFQYLVDQGNPIGDVYAVDSARVLCRGLQPVSVNALVLFEDGSKGLVTETDEELVTILHLGSVLLEVGALGVVQHNELVTKVGKGFVGRVVSALGQPLDGKGPIAADNVWPVFSKAPPLIERKMLDDQLETGTIAVDGLFPIALGQRMAVLGDSKSGKSSLATQVTVNQKGTDRIVVYALISKKKSDVNELLAKLTETGALANTIVVVSTSFDALAATYLTPYVACSMAEYLWQVENIDTIIIYDDLTAHAQAHRELSLLTGVSPGRDSYPGSMFYAHSSLLERAGRLEKNGKTLTSLPLVLAAGGDITAFLPTNIMSITDGQYIFDMEVFRSGVRPAINTGLSVSRVGGRGHNNRQKKQGDALLKSMAAYGQASEFARFGSELSEEARLDLVKGDLLKKLMTQAVGEIYTLMEQQILLEVVLSVAKGQTVDVSALKLMVKESAAKIKDSKLEESETAFDAIVAEMKSKCVKSEIVESDK